MGFLDSIFDPGAGDRARARDVRASVPVPDIDQLRIQLEQYVLQGELTPAEAQAALVDASAYDQVQTDPRLRDAQMRSLAELQGISSAGGMDAVSRASFEDVLARQRAESRGDQDAIMANTRARGIYGSDVETVNRLVAASGAATRGSRAAIDTAAIAQQRRDKAIADAANLSGSMRSADLKEQSHRAAGQDAISRFNAAQRQNAELTNVAARNSAQATNLGARQAVSDANVDTRNRQTEYNAQLPLTIYQMRRGQANDVASGYEAEADAK